MSAALKALEFAALLDILRRFLVSPLGRWQLEEFAGQPVLPSREAAQAALSEVGEAMSWLRLSEEADPARSPGWTPRFDGLQDMRGATERLHAEGAVLESHEIYSLLELLDRAEQVRLGLIAEANRYPRLFAYTESLAEFRPLLRELSGKVLPNGEVADDASPALARTRRQIEQLRKSIHQLLERFVRRRYDEGVLQEDYVTIRNGRLVVPVKTTWKWRVEGVIHSTSSSGQTVFIEPVETMELNNRLARLIEEEALEVHRVLAAMSRRLHEELVPIVAAIETLARLEFLFAKAKFGSAFDCTIPTFTDNRQLRLWRARHPLLEDVLHSQSRQVVPMSLTLGGERRLVVISGPNAGGKTIVLKTVGLLALMAQSGLPVPAGDAELPWFHRILADIGDAQSIAKSLSTFSAHIRQICDMLERADEHSLVLLDELGAATDPEEGGALGVAVADHFLNLGCLAVISTHLSALKTFAATASGAQNAAVGFEQQTLSPNYRVLMGVPGQSAGLAMAHRLGMPAVIIERSRQAMKSEVEQTSGFLQHLHDLVDQQQSATRRLQEAERAVRARERELEEKWRRRETAKLKELEARIEKLISRYEAENQAALNKMAERSRRGALDAERSFARARRELREDFASVAAPAGRPAAKPSVTPGALSEGASVRLGELRANGRILRKLSDDRWEVEVGQLKLQVSTDEIAEVLPGETRTAAGRVSLQRAEGRPKTSEINVIGQSSEEARAAVDKFLDDAVLSEVDRVRIIHGHGKNVLRSALWRMFTNHPQVERYYQAEQHEGGAGATIVEIKL